MQKIIVFLLLLTGAALGLISLHDNQVASAMTELSTRPLRHMVLVGTVVKIEGSSVTLAALANPRIIKTVELNPGTEVVYRSRQVAPTELVPGKGVIVRQDIIGSIYTTRRVEIQ